MSTRFCTALLATALAISLAVLFVVAVNLNLSDSFRDDNTDARSSDRKATGDADTVRQTVQPTFMEEEIRRVVSLCRNLRGDTSNLTRQSSFHALAEMNHRALAVCENALQSDSISVRDKADVCYFVGLRCAEDQTMGARLRARLTILLPVQPIEAPPSIVTALIAAIESNDALLSENAAMALGGLGEQARPAVPRLARLAMTDAHQQVALRALDELGPTAAAATPQLVELLGVDHQGDLLDEISSPSNAAYSALKKIGEPAVPHLAVRFANTHDQRTKVRIVNLLARSAPSGHRALAESFAASADKDDRLLALAGLGLAGEQALPTLESLLESHHADRDAQRTIAAVLIAMNSDAAIRLFEKYDLREVIHE